MTFLMDPDNVERNLQSLRKLYSLLDSNSRNEYTPVAYLLDENTQFLLKRLLDFATHELFLRQSEILASQLGLSPITDLHSKKPSNVADSSATAPPAMSSQINGSQITQSGKALEAKGTFKRDLRVNLIQSNPSKDGLTEEVTYAIERIDTQLSALRFVSNRVKNEAEISSVRSHDVSVLPLDDQFVRIKSRAPLPPLPVGAVDFKKPTSHKMTMNMKPTFLDQEAEIWDEDSIETKTGQTRSGTSSDSEDEDSVSIEQASDEISGEIESNSGTNWETHTESVTESESGSSYTAQSDDDDSEDSASPPRKKRDISHDPAKQRKKAIGRFKRLKEKLVKVFHHHHHHHHYHHNHDKEQGRKPSPWKQFQKTFHQNKEKSAERRGKSESKSLVTRKQHRGGQFHALVEGLMRHRRHSKKQKHKSQSHGKKTKWWKTLKKRQGGVKFPNRGRVKLGKKHYLSKTLQEQDEN